MGRGLFDRCVMLGKIINEKRGTGLKFIYYLGKSWPFGPLIGVNLGVKPMRCQLLSASIAPEIHQIGQDHQIGILRKGVEGVDRSRDRFLAFHFGISGFDQTPVARTTRSQGKAPLVVQTAWMRPPDRSKSTP